MPLDEFCPGGHSVKDSKPIYVKCTQCGAEIEVWSDERQITCPKCGGVNSRPVAEAKA